METQDRPLNHKASTVWLICACFDYKQVTFIIINKTGIKNVAENDIKYKSGRDDFRCLRQFDDIKG